MWQYFMTVNDLYVQKLTAPSPSYLPLLKVSTVNVLNSLLWMMRGQPSSWPTVHIKDTSLLEFAPVETHIWHTYDEAKAEITHTSGWCSSAGPVGGAEKGKRRSALFSLWLLLHSTCILGASRQTSTLKKKEVQTKITNASKQHAG